MSGDTRPKPPPELTRGYWEAGNYVISDSGDLLTWYAVAKLITAELPAVVRPDWMFVSRLLIDNLIELGVLIDDFEYRHTTGGKKLDMYPVSADHRPFYEYIKSKPMYQLHMI